MLKREVDKNSFYTGIILMLIIAILVWGNWTFVVPELTTAQKIPAFAFIVGQIAAVGGIFWLKF